jgi:acyl-CoA thioesterase
MRGKADGMTIASLLAPITGKPGLVRLEHAQNWMQGRTLYGGASALVAYTMATRAFTGLPPLRAAQVGFVAPVGEEIELTAEVIRQGRSVTQVRSEIRSEGKVALSAFWLFAAARETNASHPSKAPQDWPGGPLDNDIVPAHEGAPSFIRQQFRAALRPVQRE